MRICGLSRTCFVKYLLFIKPFTRANLKIVTSSLTELLQVDRAKL